MSGPPVHGLDARPGWNLLRGRWVHVARLVHVDPDGLVRAEIYLDGERMYEVESVDTRAAAEQGGR